MENGIKMGNPTEVIVSTHMGKIKGLQQSGHQDFIGIRYAQAPVGELRFQPPRLRDNWEGLYDATRYGPIAPQAYPDTPPIQLEESEDCLSLNIYTPAADGKRRPVMVFIHGGGFLIDSGSRPRTYGGPLAETGDVVVVTIEYRMGAFGFLFTEGISPNLGLQDQVCALEWVQRHIGEFGGDPDNVTIFGESAGATSIAYLLVMPSARGLFHKAILESGAFPFESQADNQRYARNGTRKFFRELKIAPGDLAALRQAPYESILGAEKKVGGQLLFSDRAFYPAIDGTIIPADVYGALRSGCSKSVPILIGVNGEELPLFGLMLKPGLMQTLVQGSILFKLRKLGATGRHIRTLLDLYRKELPTAHREYNHLFSDELFRIPATLLAEAQQAAGANIYFYNFVHPAPKIGAASHVLELYFVFGTLKTTDIADMMQVPGTDEEIHLSQTIMNAWTAFARTGNPNYPRLPEWPPYETEKRATMFLDLRSRVVNLPFDSIRSVWMSIVDSSVLRQGAS
jgi:para-nitrobenzyl esterase